MIRRTRLLRRALVLPTLAVLCTLLAGAPARAADFVQISGAGSTWSSNAIAAWQASVARSGMRVNFAATGSSDGRNQFANGTVDFGVSEIPYGRSDNGVVDTPPKRPFAYMPIVAGGTSFMYNLQIGGKQVRNLRLSGETVTKIFTGKITRWNDAAIKKDNPALALPALKVVPVVRSDGSGTTAQFTLWMSKRYASLWNAYCGKAGRKTPCGETSNFPVVPGSGFTAQNGSLGVSGYVGQKSSVGAITYVEYSYPLNQNFPVAKLLNDAGYYTLPDANNVAVGLLKAKINNDLTQNLDGVYANQDKRTYPLSSYSYMIVPTSTAAPFTKGKGFTLAAFAYYFLCEGQQRAPELGYSPLPINLVQSALKQVAKIPGHGSNTVDIRSCNNPTFSNDGTNTLAKTAKFPPACDKQGATQCSDNGTTAASGGSGSGGSGSGDANAAGGAGTSASPGATTGAVDPDTGQPIDGSLTAGSTDVNALPVSSPTGYASGSVRLALIAVAVLALAGVAFGPPLLTRLLSGRRPS